ncbi:uncharacterized protein LOC111272442 isoform X2 [Varroa jacobsoni]|uniref:uncharacterized protein LOC111272442 isoform X2 n=1 Tax=Varroa jacobsoni TaxID=62625 RepID=UPI000BF2D998|nr:uncharacterized protein LOC111272442 isoform X2 [Varroa jacobsoni]
MSTVSPESALEGLTPEQSERVPVETRVDEVCRDLFELKQFAQRIVSLLPRVTLEVVAKKTQGAFSVKEIAHWRNALAAIQLPFRFDTGSPQAELYALAKNVEESELNEAGPESSVNIKTAKITQLPHSSTSIRLVATSLPSQSWSPAAALDSKTIPQLGHCLSVTGATTSTKKIAPTGTQEVFYANPLSSSVMARNLRSSTKKLTMGNSPSKNVVAISSTGVQAKVVAVIDNRERSSALNDPMKRFAVKETTSLPNIISEDSVKTSTSKTSDESKRMIDDEGDAVCSSQASFAVAVNTSATSKSTKSFDTNKMDLDKDCQELILPEVVDSTTAGTRGTEVILEVSEDSSNDSSSNAKNTLKVNQSTNVNNVPVENSEATSAIDSEKNPQEKPLSRLEPFVGNPFTSTFPMLEYDLPIVEISPILRKYLLQFRVEPVEYIWWRKQRGDSIEWLTQPREVLDKADEFLTFITNLLEQISCPDKSAILSVAKAYGVQAHSLERWIHYRKLFNQDRTALKFSLFGESSLRKCTIEDRSILQLEKISRFKPPPKRRRVSFRVGRMQCSDQEVVERVMSFYMLSPAILDQLPLPENISVQESPEFLHLLPIEKLLYDLESIIINKCEVSQFQEMFPADAGRVCFGPALINRSGRLRSLYQLPLGDAVAAAVEDNSRLRSKEVTLPAYFDTAYDGAQPVVPVDATCALVNAIHTGSTNRDRQRVKTRAKIMDVLKKYGAVDFSDEVACDEEQEVTGLRQEFVVPFISRQETDAGDVESDEYYVYQEAEEQYYNEATPSVNVHASSNDDHSAADNEMYEIRVKQEPTENDE